jgi:hypothetical protein
MSPTIQVTAGNQARSHGPEGRPHRPPRKDEALFLEALRQS